MTDYAEENELPPLSERLRQIADDIFHGRMMDQGHQEDVLEAAKIVGEDELRNSDLPGAAPFADMAAEVRRIQAERTPSDG